MNKITRQQRRALQRWLDSKSPRERAMWQSHAQVRAAGYCGLRRWLEHYLIWRRYGLGPIAATFATRKIIQHTA